jgi:acyl-CoA synthetase (AMP-forming)/AMP-acid ligase II
MQTVHEMLRRAAGRTPGAPALVDPRRGLRISHAELLAQVEHCAAALRAAGIRRGDRVAVVPSNSVEWIVAILALHRAEAVPALLNPRLKPAELAQLASVGQMAAAVVAANAPYGPDLRDACSGNLLFTVGGSAANDISQLPAAAAALPQPAPAHGDPAFVFYTSGTTGLPKGAVIPHRAAENRVLFMAIQAGYRHGAHNCILGLMPLYHVIGFFAVLVKALAFNGRYVVVPEFKPDEVLSVIESEQVTGLFVTPTHLDAMLAAMGRTQASLASLQHVTFAGATMPDPVLEQVNLKMPGEKVNIYGTTEMMNSLYLRSPSSGTLLQPGFYSEVRLVRPDGDVHDLVAPGQEGELLVSTGSDAAFSGYLNRPNATAQKVRDGWYRTSDMAVRRSDGLLQILGRVDDMIISGGENIHPSEIEKVLGGHPSVAEVAVVGVADQHWGQKVVACVVAKGERTLDSKELDDFCRGSSLADFKRPRQYVFLRELPKSAVNKVLRRELIGLAAQPASGARHG